MPTASAISRVEVAAKPFDVNNLAEACRIWSRGATVDDSDTGMCRGRPGRARPPTTATGALTTPRSQASTTSTRTTGNGAVQPHHDRAAGRRCERAATAGCDTGSIDGTWLHPWTTVSIWRTATSESSPSISAVVGVLKTPDKHTPELPPRDRRSTGQFGQLRVAAPVRNP